MVGGTAAIVTMSAWDYLPVSAKDSLAAGTERSPASCNHLLPACFSQSLCSLVSLGLMLYDLIGHDGSSGRDSSSTDIAGNLMCIGRDQDEQSRCQFPLSACTSLFAYFIQDPFAAPSSHTTFTYFLHGSNNSIWL